MFWAVLVLFGQLLTRKPPDSWLQTAFVSKFFFWGGKGLNIRQKETALFGKDLSYCNKKKLFVNKKVQEGSDVTNNFKRLMFILVKPVFNHLIWKNSWIYSVITLMEWYLVSVCLAFWLSLADSLLSSLWSKKVL